MGAGLTLEWEPLAANIADPALSAFAAIILVIFNYPFSKYIFSTYYDLVIFEYYINKVAKNYIHNFINKSFTLHITFTLCEGLPLYKT